MFNLRRIRQAVHGRGDAWVEVGPSTAPSSFSSPTPMNWSPNYGGRWRTNMPGSGDQHINDDSDKSKSTRGNPEDFDPENKNNLINDKLDAGLERCVVTYFARDGEDPKDKIDRLEKGGLDPRIEGNQIVIEVEGLPAATRVQALLPGAVITLKTR